MKVGKISFCGCFYLMVDPPFILLLMQFLGKDSFPTCSEDICQANLRRLLAGINTNISINGDCDNDGKIEMSEGLAILNKLAVIHIGEIWTILILPFQGRPI